MDTEPMDHDQVNLEHWKTHQYLTLFLPYTHLCLEHRWKYAAFQFQTVNTNKRGI